MKPRSTIRCVIAVILGLTHSITQTQAKDFGQQGTLMEIQEKSLLQVMLDKLNKMQGDGALEKHQKEIAEKAKQRIQRPVPVSHLKRADEETIFFFDPTLVVQDDIRDHQGKSIAAKGTRVNPLEQLAWGQPMVFFNGDDPAQREWVFANFQEADFVLTCGAPLDVSEKYGHHIYFDQGGSLVKKLGIFALPAVVVQEGLLLKITQVKL